MMCQEPFFIILRAPPPKKKFNTRSIGTTLVCMYPAACMGIKGPVMYEEKEGKN